MAQQVTEHSRQTPLVVFRDRLLARKEELAHALEGSGISPDRFIRTALTAAQQSPDLVTDVTFPSLWNALLKACRDRLLPDGKHGAIIPYKKTAVWVPMIRGLLNRFEQSGQYKWVTADFHRADDLSFDTWVDEHGQHFLHRPGPRNGAILETYAAATTINGAFFVTVITPADMAKIRSVSRASSQDAPWQQWPEQMMLKSALRRLCKILPTPVEVDELLSDDETLEAPAITRPTLARPRGANNSLEHFAGDMEPERHDQETGEVESSPLTPHGEQQEQKREPVVIPITISTAHERGVQAKAEGHKRTAMPGEYREADRAQEAFAWRKGWDGEPLLYQEANTDAAAQ